MVMCVLCSCMLMCVWCVGRGVTCGVKCSDGDHSSSQLYVNKGLTCPEGKSAWEVALLDLTRYSHHAPNCLLAVPALARGSWNESGLLPLKEKNGMSHSCWKVSVEHRFAFLFFLVVRVVVKTVRFQLRRRERESNVSPSFAVSRWLCPVCVDVCV